MKKFRIIPVFVPHWGCAHQCSFCNQHHITGQGAPQTPEGARERIERYLSTIDANRFRVEAAFYGGSFTAIEQDAQDALLAVAKEYLDAGRIHGVRLSTRPDCVDGATAHRLLRFGVTAVELGAQSMDDGVLLKNGRGHSAGDVCRSVEVLRAHGLGVGLQMMTGLWGDTPGGAVETARRLAALRPDFMRIYPTLVLKNTYLHKLYEAGEYTPMSLEDTVSLCGRLLRLLKKEGIPVIRLGLCLGGAELEGSFVAGPYHPRLRELAEQSMDLPAAPAGADA